MTLFAPFVYSWIGEKHQLLIKAGTDFCRSQKVPSLHYTCSLLHLLTRSLQWQTDEATKYATGLDSFFQLCLEPIAFLQEQAYFDPCPEPEKKDSFQHRYGKAVAKSLTIFVEHIYNNFLDVLPTEDKRELRETFSLKEDKPQVAKVSALMKASRDFMRFTKTKRNELLSSDVRGLFCLARSILSFADPNTLTHCRSS